MRFVTNFEDCPTEERLADGGTVYYEPVSRYQEIWNAARDSDAVVLDGSFDILRRLVLGFLAKPWRKKPLIAVDLVLRKPLSAKQKCAAWLRRRILRRVDHFIHYFQDLSGYERYFGITPDQMIADAKVVVIPTSQHSLCASGVSTYLDAMYLGKTVIISHGPCDSKLLTDQVMLIPPHDPQALADAIRQVWEDNELRQRLSSRGREYALSVGDS